jgi:hypothetical protein
MKTARLVIKEFGVLCPDCGAEVRPRVVPDWTPPNVVAAFNIDSAEAPMCHECGCFVQVPPIPARTKDCLLGAAPPAEPEPPEEEG